MRLPVALASMVAVAVVAVSATYLSPGGKFATTPGQIREQAAAFPSRIQSGLHKTERGDGGEELQNTDYHDPPSPIGHVPLGVKIILGALIFVGGCCSLIYALNYVGPRRQLEAVIYNALGVAAILTGGAFCLSLVIS